MGNVKVYRGTLKDDMFYSDFSSRGYARYIYMKRNTLDKGESVLFHKDWSGAWIVTTVRGRNAFKFYSDSSASMFIATDRDGSGRPIRGSDADRRHVEETLAESVASQEYRNRYHGD